MPKKYTHIEKYENEIIEMKEKGLTHREIRDKFSFTKEQIKSYVKRNNAKKRNLGAGIALKTKRRPPKACEISEADKMNELKYIFARKGVKINSLKMRLCGIFSRTQKESETINKISSNIQTSI